MAENYLKCMKDSVETVHERLLEKPLAEVVERNHTKAYHSKILRAKDKEKILKVGKVKKPLHLHSLTASYSVEMIEVRN